MDHPVYYQQRCVLRISKKFPSKGVISMDGELNKIPKAVGKKERKTIAQWPDCPFQLILQCLQSQRKETKILFLHCERQQKEKMEYIGHQLSQLPKMTEINCKRQQRNAAECGRDGERRSYHFNSVLLLLLPKVTKLDIQIICCSTSIAAIIIILAYYYSHHINNKLIIYLVATTTYERKQ